VSEQRSKRIKTRINRIAGQVSGIKRMLEEERYCVEILNQIAAVRSALEALGIEVLMRHIESCVLDHDAVGGHSLAKHMTNEQLVAEVQTVLSRFLR
jgi:CsoR family transcriptional regulator, copper-sensing transcriptional repressor